MAVRMSAALQGLYTHGWPLCSRYASRARRRLMTGAERANPGGPGRDFPEAPLHRGEEWQRVAENERPGKPVPRRLLHPIQSRASSALLYELFEGPGGKIA
jgi:hypothetical protein